MLGRYSRYQCINLKQNIRCFSQEKSRYKIPKYVIENLKFMKIESTLFYHSNYLWSKKIKSRTKSQWKYVVTNLTKGREKKIEILYITSLQHVNKHSLPLWFHSQWIFFSNWKIDIYRYCHGDTCGIAYPVFPLARRGFQSWNVRSCQVVISTKVVRGSTWYIYPKSICYQQRNEICLFKVINILLIMQNTKR